MKMWIAVLAVVYTIHSFVSTTKFRFNSSLTQTPNSSITTLPNWTSELAYMHAMRGHQSQVNGRQEEVGIGMTGSKQSCHELEYNFAENSVIN